MEKDIIENLIECLSDSLEYREYSGKNMYGRKCIAFKCTPKELFNEVLSYISGLDTNDIDMYDIQDFISNMTEDSLGMGSVVYFPKYKPIERK